MRFLLGFVLGALCGAGAMYLALVMPWQGEGSTVAMDAGVTEGADAGTKRKGRGKRRPGERREGEAGGELSAPELSAADRALVWKGDAVSLPPASADFTAGAGGRALEAGEINQVIASQSDGLLRCIAEARGEVVIDSNVVLKLLVNERGAVTKVRVQAPAFLFEQGFYGCASSAARALRFPATGAPTVVTAPYELY